MILIDTSVWINIFSDKKGIYSQKLHQKIAEKEIVLTRFQQLELLQGCRDEKEWEKLNEYLDVQVYIEMLPHLWKEAARIYYMLRKKGITIRSPIDCCIAQIAIEEHLLLLHDDHDFIAISEHFPLHQQRYPI